MKYINTQEQKNKMAMEIINMNNSKNIYKYFRVNIVDIQKNQIQIKKLEKKHNERQKKQNYFIKGIFYKQNNYILYLYKILEYKDAGNYYILIPNNNYQLLYILLSIKQRL